MCVLQKHKFETLHKKSDITKSIDIIIIDDVEYEFLHQSHFYHTVSFVRRNDEYFTLKHDGLPNINEVEREISYFYDGNTVESNDVWFKLIKVKKDHHRVYGKIISYFIPNDIPNHIVYVDTVDGSFTQAEFQALPNLKKGE